MTKLPRIGVTVVDGDKVLVGEVEASAAAEINKALEEKPQDREIFDDTVRRVRVSYKRKIENVTIYTTETRIGHGLGVKPFWYDVHFKGSNTISWVEPARADDQFIYLKANAECTADIIVEA